MKHSVIVGVDVSKATLDIFCTPSETFLQITNNAAGFKKWLPELFGLSDSLDNLLVVMEHTGRYSYRLEQFLQAQGIAYVKIPALQIKRSLGVTRGKTDKIDARRIANYGWLRRDILESQEVPQPQFKQLQSLLSARKKLVTDRGGYKARVKEMVETGSCPVNSLEIKILCSVIKKFNASIKELELEIQTIIRSTESLKKTHDLLTSIKGIGWLVATAMICYTGNFKKFTHARKFNCYAGIAPFKHESGTSIRGRSRVSHLANKEAKALLNLAAFSALRCDQELKNYYQRRVAEGKRKMSCVNIIRAKLVSRMFAVVKRQTPYYELAA
jgi:transposase